MEIKVFEIRDDATRISVMAIKMTDSDPHVMSILGGSGWYLGDVDDEEEDPGFLVVRLDPPYEAAASPYEHSYPRPMERVHEHIVRNYDKLVHGQVIDWRTLTINTPPVRSDFP